MSKLAPLIAVVGPTASGKSQLGMQLARHHQGEIICADSRTIYRGMDIGTAKPSLQDQEEAPHHLLNFLDPNQPYSAAEFKEIAVKVINEIHDRGHLPILVGGTGLYAQAVLYDYRFPAGPSNSLRQELSQLPLNELVTRLQQLDPERAASIDLQNSRRVIRAIETAGQPRIAPKALPPGIRIIGLNPGMEELERCIAKRTRDMLAGGLIPEVQGLLQRYDPVIEPLNTVGYREVIEFLNEKLTERELETAINLHTRQLAKRQLTWFKRNPDIQWVESFAAGQQLAADFLASAPAV